jgi:hypothetical protein
MRRSLLSPMPSERLIISKTFYIRCLLRCVMWVRWICFVPNLNKEILFV